MLEITKDTPNSLIIKQILINVDTAKGSDFLIGFMSGIIDKLADCNKKESRECLETALLKSYELCKKK
jgi:hypothetical protein